MYIDLFNFPPFFQNYLTKYMYVYSVSYESIILLQIQARLCNSLTSHLLQFPNSSNLLQGIRLVHQSSDLVSHLSVAVLYLLSIKQTTCVAIKELGQKTKRHLGQ